jgi:RND family efflux transporter MFP subunit
MGILQAPSTQTQKGRSSLAFFVGVCVALVLVIAGGIRQRRHAANALARATEQAAISAVDVMHPFYDGGADELVLPGTAQAYLDTPLYARTSGYLKAWYFDIGSRVRKGQLLAVIESPEVDKQLMQANANLTTAQANLNLAVITLKRDERLLKTQGVSEQERDNSGAAANADRSIVESNRAEVARLEQLQSFERIYAPFDGVITARNTDVGALIESGAGKEIFHLGSTNKLRVYVAIPENWSRLARPGTHATLVTAEFPDRVFPCTLVRNAGAIDPTARTLLSEFDVENATGELLPGAYAQLHLKVPSGSSPLMIPSNTLLFRSEGMRVAVVRNGRTQLLPIQIGRDYGAKVEVASGLTAQDMVILDPSDSLIDGLPVRVHAVQVSR